MSSAPTNGTAQPLSEAEESRIERREERAKMEREKLEQQRKGAAQRQQTNKERDFSGGRRSSSSSKRRSSKKSPVLEALKIGIGGLLAIPIAYLLLMWVFSRDPLSLSKSIESFAPALVPPAFKFEGDVDESPKPEMNDELNRSDSTPESISVPDSDFNIDSELMEFKL